MRRFTLHELLAFACAVVIFILLLQSWDAVISFIGIVLTAIIPLVVGAAIAYVVSIPTKFLERHLFPNTSAAFLKAIRRPLALIVTIVILVSVLALTSSLLIPALIDTVRMVQKNGQQFIEDMIQMPLLKPVRESVHEFINGEIFQSLKNLDINGLVNSVFGGTFVAVTTHVFTVVSIVMTAFFGMLFSFILLTDTTNAGHQIREIVEAYIGRKRASRIWRVLDVANRSFHSFLVRQFVEATILGTVGAVVLLPTGFPYAIGVGVLMGLAALVPIVGYPVGLVFGAFMTAIFNMWAALLFVVCVAVAQVFEATFILPHVGDRRTVLPPIWVTVAVTIGGGVAGFVGMLVAIPVGSTIRQLVLMGAASHRRRELEKEAQSKQEAVANSLEAESGMAQGASTTAEETEVADA